MSRSTKTPETKPVAQAVPPVTFDVNDPALQAIIAQAVAVRLATIEAEKPASNGKSDRSAKNELATIRAFKKQGFGVVTPNVDTFTFNRWVSKGFRPKEGSKSVKVANLRLFCKAQVRPLTAEEKQEMQAKLDEAVVSNKEIVSITEAHPQ